jgi:hypothetical protein
LLAEDLDPESGEMEREFRVDLGIITGVTINVY